MYCATVQRWRTQSLAKRDAENLLRTTSAATLPPPRPRPPPPRAACVITPPTPSTPPDAWQSGSAQYTRSSPRSRAVTASSVPAARKRRCDTGDAFGSPVVPDV